MLSLPTPKKPLKRLILWWICLSAQLIKNYNLNLWMTVKLQKFLSDLSTNRCLSLELKFAELLNKFSTFSTNWSSTFETMLKSDSLNVRILESLGPGTSKFCYLDFCWTGIDQLAFARQAPIWLLYQMMGWIYLKLEKLVVNCNNMENVTLVH